VFTLCLGQRGLRNVLGDITRPSFGGVEGNYPQWNANTDRSECFFGLIRLDISAAQRPEVVQHDIDGDIKGWLGASGVW
jgi:hypothetical protein